MGTDVSWVLMFMGTNVSWVLMFMGTNVSWVLMFHGYWCFRGKISCTCSNL